MAFHVCTNFLHDGKSIELQDIHPFWKTLDMEVVKDSAPDSDEENKLLQSLFDRMIQQPRNVKRRYIEELEKIVHPKWKNLKEPLVRQTKGRLKKNATKRDPSAWEYAEKKCTGKSCKKRSSSGSLHGC